MSATLTGLIQDFDFELVIGGNTGDDVRVEIHLFGLLVGSFDIGEDYVPAEGGEEVVDFGTAAARGFGFTL